MAKNSTHVDVITLSDGRQICQSYGVTVAAFIPRGYSNRCAKCGEEANTVPLSMAGEHHKFGPVADHEFTPISGYVRTDARYSVTTSRHMNQFAGKTAPEVPHEELKALTAPVLSRL